MKFNGLWENEINNEVIKISRPVGGDFYILEYAYENKEFQNSEKIRIFLSNDKHALLPHSEKFGRNDIHILTPDSFQIGEGIYNRKVIKE